MNLFGLTQQQVQSEAQPLRVFYNMPQNVQMGRNKVPTPGQPVAHRSMIQHQVQLQNTSFVNGLQYSLQNSSKKASHIQTNLFNSKRATISSIGSKPIQATVKDQRKDIIERQLKQLEKQLGFSALAIDPQIELTDPPTDTQPSQIKSQPVEHTKIKIEHTVKQNKTEEKETEFVYRPARPSDYEPKEEVKQVKKRPQSANLNVNNQNLIEHIFGGRIL
ncbi:Hypothetical_protein [Hexamita inflata]|uniref:Hypothetical_protein n=1 Tax=Hexamita inflata TaxID=28002 RepID=A0ABP1HDV8_9EUKA